MRGHSRMRQVVWQSLALASTLTVAQSAARAADLYGNASDLEAELRRMLESNEQEKRRTAVERLAGLEMRIAAPYLMEKLRDGEPVVRARAARALGPGAVLEAAPLLLACMNDVESTVRAACVEGFGQYGALPVELQKRAATTLSRVMADAQYEVRLEVLRAVERLVRTEALSSDEQLHLLGPALLRSEDEHVVVRRAACSLLGHLAAGSKDARKRIAVALLGRLSDASRDVRVEAISSLTRLADPSAAAAALRLLSDPADDVRRQAVLYLGQVGYAPALPLLTDLLQRSPEPLRTSAAQAIAALLRAMEASGSANQPATTAALTALIHSLEREEVRPAARAALLSLRGLSVPLLSAELSAVGTPVPRALAIVDVLRDLVREGGKDLRPESRAQITRALQAELLRSRLPRERVLLSLSALADPALLPLLLSLLTDADRVVREQALRALARLPGLDDRALDAVLTASRDLDSAVRGQAALLLGRLPAASAQVRLRELLRDPAIEVRAAAVQGIAAAAESAKAAGRASGLDGGEIPALVSLISVSADSPAEARVHRLAAQALGQIAAVGSGPRRQVTQALLAALRGLRPSAAAQDLVTALGAALRTSGGGENSVPELPLARSLLLDLATAAGEADSEAGLVAADALDALSALGDVAVIGRLSRLLGHSDALRRSRAAAALGSLLSRPGGEGAGSALITLLGSDRAVNVVAEAAWALGKLSPEASGPAVAALRQILAQREGLGGERAVRVNALGALARLGRAEPGDSQWLSEGEPLSRANAALLLSSLSQKTPGLSARLRNLAQTDADHRVRAAAAQALRSVGPAPRTGRGSFLGLVQLDVDRQPLPDAPFRLTLPDGLSRIAVTDRRGVLREEQVPAGSCEVESLSDAL